MEFATRSQNASAYNYYGFYVKIAITQFLEIRSLVYPISNMTKKCAGSVSFQEARLDG